MRTFLERLHLTLTGVTLLWIPVLCLYAIRARDVLGRWPRYNQPDPKDLGLTCWHATVGYSLEISFYGMLSWIVLSAVMFKLLPRPTLYRRAAWFGLGLSLLLADPTGLVEWYFD